jgi:hypothetical protein
MSCSHARLSRPAGLPIPLRKPISASVATLATLVLVRSVSMTRFTFAGCQPRPHTSISDPGDRHNRRELNECIRVVFAKQSFPPPLRRQEAARDHHDWKELLALFQHPGAGRNRPLVRAKPATLAMALSQFGGHTLVDSQLQFRLDIAGKKFCTGVNREESVPILGLQCAYGFSPQRYHIFSGPT